jgi:acetyl esterase/lipase
MLGVSATNRELEGDGPWQDYSSQVQAVAASATPTRPMSRGRPDAQLASIAPMTYVSADAPPFLLFHEASDRTVDVSHSDDFVKALKLAGAKDVTYRRLTDGSGHGAFNKNLKESSADMAEFFARTLKWQGDSKKSK